MFQPKLLKPIVYGPISRMQLRSLRLSTPALNDDFVEVTK